MRHCGIIWSVLPKVLVFHIGNLDVARLVSEVKSIITNNHFTIKHFGNDILEIQEYFLFPPGTY